MLKVAIFERNHKTADDLKAYIRHFYYGDVEVVDASAGDKRGIEEMKKFQPDIFIFCQMGEFPNITETQSHPEKPETERHIEACRLILATFERRPYLVAICGDDRFTAKQYRRFKGRCEEWGYDSVHRRGEVNSASIAFWVNRSKRSGGTIK